MNSLLGVNVISAEQLPMRYTCCFVTFDGRITPAIVIGANSEYWDTL
jgi:hypothetical protein